METLILFARAPIPGQAKTRLARGVGEEKAARLAGAFLQDTAAVCGRWREERVAVDPNRRVVVYASPDAADPAITEAARVAGARVETQVGGTLGERLLHAFEQEFSLGARAVAAIGADSPTLPVHMLNEAFRALHWERVALGPTFDGGYWIVGSQRPVPDLFSEMPWSTARLMEATLTRLHLLGVSAAVLPFWFDVDEPADLERLVWHARVVRHQHPDRVAATWQSLIATGIVATHDGAERAMGAAEAAGPLGRRVM